MVGAIPSQWQTDLRGIDASCCGCWRRRIAQPSSSLRRALISACRRAISSGRRGQRQRKQQDSITPPPERCKWIISRANPKARAKVGLLSENCARIQPIMRLLVKRRLHNRHQLPYLRFLSFIV